MDVFKKKKTGFSKNHPTYIYKKINDDYIFVGITHAEVTNNTKNIKLSKIRIQQIINQRIIFQKQAQIKFLLLVKNIVIGRCQKKIKKR